MLRNPQSSLVSMAMMTTKGSAFGFASMYPTLPAMATGDTSPVSIASSTSTLTTQSRTSSSSSAPESDNNTSAPPTDGALATIAQGTPCDTPLEEVDSYHCEDIDDESQGAQEQTPLHGSESPRCIHHILRSLSIPSLASASASASIPSQNLAGIPAIIEHHHHAESNMYDDDDDFSSVALSCIFHKIRTVDSNSEDQVEEQQSHGHEQLNDVDVDVDETANEAEQECDSPSICIHDLVDPIPTPEDILSDVLRSPSSRPHPKQIVHPRPLEQLEGTASVSTASPSPSPGCMVAKSNHTAHPGTSSDLDSNSESSDVSKAMNQVDDAPSANLMMPTITHPNETSDHHLVDQSSLSVWADEIHQDIAREQCHGFNADRTETSNFDGSPQPSIRHDKEGGKHQSIHKYECIVEMDAMLQDTASGPTQPSCCSASPSASVSTSSMSLVSATSQSMSDCMDCEGKDQAMVQLSLLVARQQDRIQELEKTIRQLKQQAKKHRRKHEPVTTSTFTATQTDDCELENDDQSRPLPQEDILASCCESGTCEAGRGEITNDVIQSQPSDISSQHTSATTSASSVPTSPIVDESERAANVDSDSSDSINTARSTTDKANDDDVTTPHHLKEPAQPYADSVAEDSFEEDRADNTAVTAAMSVSQSSLPPSACTSQSDESPRDNANKDQTIEQSDERAPVLTVERVRHVSIMINNRPAKYCGPALHQSDQWMPEGAGVARFESGDLYLGEFHRGQMHGHGTLYPASSRRAQVLPKSESIGTTSCSVKKTSVNKISLKNKQEEQQKQEQRQQHRRPRGGAYGQRDKTYCSIVGMDGQVSRQTWTSLAPTKKG